MVISLGQTTWLFFAQPLICVSQHQALPTATTAARAEVQFCSATRFKRMMTHPTRKRGVEDAANQ